jgi:hydroxymethylbilane synthase
MDLIYRSLSGFAGRSDSARAPYTARTRQHSSYITGMTQTIRIATRKSPLAMWQAEHVRARLAAAHNDLKIILVPMTTKGDQWLEMPLSRIGGKNLFVKELERALIDGSADIAVHSMKDVAAELPEGLGIVTVLERENPSDALVAGAGDNSINGVDDLPEGARIGTCSLRRRSQLLAVRPDLQIGMLRGNVNTRLAQLDAGDHDAIVLAAAGLQRLEFDDRINAQLPHTISLPAIGQGIIGIEARSDDQETQSLLSALHDAPAARRLTAERAVSRTLNGGCSAPIAGHATLEADQLQITARVIDLNGKVPLEHSATTQLCAANAGDDSQALAAADTLGCEVANALLAQGAQALLDEAAALVAQGA